MLALKTAFKNGIPEGWFGRNDNPYSVFHRVLALSPSLVAINSTELLKMTEAWWINLPNAARDVWKCLHDAISTFVNLYPAASDPPRLNQFVEGLLHHFGAITIADLGAAAPPAQDLLSASPFNAADSFPDQHLHSTSPFDVTDPSPEQGLHSASPFDVTAAPLLVSLTPLS